MVGFSLGEPDDDDRGSPGTLPYRPPEAGGVAAKVLTAVIVVGLAVGAVAYFALPASRIDGPTAPTTSGPLGQPPATGSGLSLKAPPAPAAVLAGVAASRSVDAHRLEHLVGRTLTSPRLGHHLGFAVAALGSTHLAMRAGGPQPITPASTTKLLTTTTALTILGPDHRFATTVKQGGSPRRIVLVGGGDPLLTDRRTPAEEAAESYPRPATLQQLAARTAASLSKAGVHRVSLGYDDSLFTGPAVNPQWPHKYIPESVVSPISSLWVDEGRAVAGLAARVADPAAEAASLFGALLAEQGVAVDPTVRDTRVSHTAATLATVESPPLAEIVQHILALSDNEGAEVLLRQVAIAAGRPGSSAAGVQVVRQTISGLGIDLRHAVIYDGSGLSRHDRLPIQVLVDVLQADAAADHPDLRPVVTSLPVAGFTGTLAYRFVDDEPSGLGLVTAKTGTLTDVHALAGVITARSGAVLVFAAVADRVPVPKTNAARAQLDRIAATLASCGC